MQARFRRSSFIPALYMSAEGERRPACQGPITECFYILHVQEGTTKPVASAYPEPVPHSMPMGIFNWKVYLVLGDCFLIGLAPVLVHMAKGPDGKYDCPSPALILP